MKPEMVELIYIGEDYYVGGKVMLKAGDEGLMPKYIWEKNDPEILANWRLK